jgi:hypothetical protein
MTTDASARNAEKSQIMKRLMATGATVRIVLDPRQPNVTGIPEYLCHQPALLLEFGYNLTTPTDDFEVGPALLGCTLSFNHTPTYVAVSLSSVFAIVCEALQFQMLFAESVPADAYVTGPAPAAAVAPTGTAPGVISLDSRRTPQDRARCEARRAGLLAPRGGDTTPPAPRTGGAA